MGRNVWIFICIVSLLCFPITFHGCEGCGSSILAGDAVEDRAHPDIEAADLFEERDEFILETVDEMFSEEDILEDDASADIADIIDDEPEPLADPFWSIIFDTGQNDANTSVASVDGGYMVAGVTDAFIPPDEPARRSRLWMVKLDEYGNVIWQKAYLATGFNVRVLEGTRDGGAILAGGILTSIDFGAEFQPFIGKLNEDGTVAWHHTYMPESYVMYLDQTADGGYIAGITGFHEDIWILRIDGNGNSLWAKAYVGGDDDLPRGITHTADGGYLVAATTGSFVIGGNSDMWVLKLDSEGEIEWQKVFGSLDRDHGGPIIETPDGGAVLTGQVEYQNDETGRWERDMVIVKLDAGGNILWQQTYDIAMLDEPETLKKDNDGGYIIGALIEPSDFDLDLALMKIDESGNILWHRSYGGGALDWYFSLDNAIGNGYIIGGVTLSYSWLMPSWWILRTDAQGRIPGDCPPGVGEDTVLNASDVVVTSMATEISATPMILEIVEMDFALEDIETVQRIQCTAGH